MDPFHSRRTENGLLFFSPTVVDVRLGHLNLHLSVLVFRRFCFGQVVQQTSSFTFLHIFKSFIIGIHKLEYYLVVTLARHHSVDR